MLFRSGNTHNMGITCVPSKTLCPFSKGCKMAYLVFLSVSFVMCISGAKFKEHCFNISRDILQYFTVFSCKQYDVITDLICIIKNVNVSKTKKRYFKKKNYILLYFERPFK